MSGVGVVICTCGGSMKYEDLWKFVDSLKDVTGMIIVDNFCKNPIKALRKLKNDDVDRVLIVACSEKLSIGEEKLMKALIEAGFDPAMCEVANVREGCWLIGGSIDKAKDIVAMAHAKLLLNQPSLRVKPKNSVLIVGGGVAGLECAKALAREGINVTLVEKEGYVGGHLLKFPTVWQSKNYPSVCTPLCIGRILLKEIEAEENVKIITNAEVVGVRTENGNYVVEILRRAHVNPMKCIGCGRCAEVCPVEIPDPFNYGITMRKAIDKPCPQIDYFAIDTKACEMCGKCLEVCPADAIVLREEKFEDSFGAVVIATGFEDKGVDVNKGSKKVVTMMEFERIMGMRKIPKRVTFILCSEDNERCHKFCCPNTVKIVARIKTISPDRELVVIYSRLKLMDPAFLKFKEKAEEMGVRFINAKVKEMKESEGIIKLVLNNGEIVETDLVVIPTSVNPSKDVFEKFGLPLDVSGYPLEFQPRNFNAGRTMRKRVYVVGCAGGSRDIQDSVTSARAVAKMVLEDLREEAMKFYVTVSEHQCKDCKMCAKVCPHGAISCKNGRIFIDPALCMGCGLCYGQCKNGGLVLVNLTELQIIEMARVAFRHVKPGEPRILILTCHWCSTIANDYMGYMRLKLPDCFRVIRLRCAGSVRAEVLKSLVDKGYADIVIVAGCPPVNCHHIHGSINAKESVESLKDPRIRYTVIGAGDALKLADLIKSVAKS